MTTVCLTFDFDATSLWLSSFKQATATPASRGVFGATHGVPRILDLLSAQDIPATFFVPSHTAVSHPEAVTAIAAQGHEIALHGYCHETPVGLTRGEEGALLDRSISRMQSVLGAGYAPQGYRSPAWDLSAHSIALFEERGLIYDSSMMASDFFPYRARKGHILTEDGYDPGAESGRIVEMPVAWELDDFPYFSFLNRPMYSGLRSPDEVFNIWRDEFNFCASLGGGVFTLTMHPQIIGRGPRIAMLGRLIQHMKAQENTRFSSVSDEARRQDEQLPRADETAPRG